MKNNNNNNKNIKSNITSITYLILTKLLIEGFWDKTTTKNNIIIIINNIKTKTTITTNVAQLLLTQFWPNFLDPIFGGLNFCRPHFFGPNLFRLKYFGNSKIFDQKKFLYKNFFGYKFGWSAEPLSKRKKEKIVWSYRKKFPQSAIHEC